MPQQGNASRRYPLRWPARRACPTRGRAGLSERGRQGSAASSPSAARTATVGEAASPQRAAPTPTSAPAPAPAPAPALDDEDLAVFLEMSNEIFGVFDRAQGLVWNNGAAAALLGYDEEELATMSLVDLI